MFGIGKQGLKDRHKSCADALQKWWWEGGGGIEEKTARTAAQFSVFLESRSLVSSILVDPKSAVPHIALKLTKLVFHK